MSRKNVFSHLKKVLLYSIDNVTTIVFAIVSVSIIARGYGPENLGKFSLVQNLSQLFMFCAVLGVDHFIVRDLAENHEDGELLGSTIFVQAMGWLIYFVIIGLVLIFTGKIHQSLDYISILLAVSLRTFFTRATVVRFYYQAINKPRAIASSAMISRIISALYIVAAVMLNARYTAVVWYFPLQAFLQFLLLMKAYRKDTAGIKHWSVTGSKIKKLLNESKPVIIASMFYPLFINADVLIVSHFIDEQAIGEYAAGRRLITQFLFLGSILTMTFYRSIIKIKEAGTEEEYKRYLRGIGKLLFLCSFVLSLSTFLARGLIVDILFGSEFEETKNILGIIVWSWVFIIPAALYSRLLIIHRLAKYELVKSVVTGISSIFLNLLLIPVFGVLGASIVSLLSYALADFLIYGLFNQTRFFFMIALESMFSLFNIPETIEDIRYVLNQKQYA